MYQEISCDVTITDKKMQTYAEILRIVDADHE